MVAICTAIEPPEEMPEIVISLRFEGKKGFGGVLDETPGIHHGIQMSKGPAFA
jgi:hypothetical protein